MIKIVVIKENFILLHHIFDYDVIFTLNFSIIAEISPRIAQNIRHFRKFDAEYVEIIKTIKRLDNDVHSIKQ